MGSAPSQNSNRSDCKSIRRGNCSFGQGSGYTSPEAFHSPQLLMLSGKNFATAFNLLALRLLEFKP